MSTLETMTSNQYDIEYATWDALWAAYESEIKHGGVFIQSMTQPAALSSIGVRINLVNRASIVTQGRVVNVMRDGFFIQFLDPSVIAELENIISQTQRTASSSDGHTEDATVGATVDDNAGPQSEGLAPALSGPVRNVWDLIDTTSGVPLGQQVRTLSVAERVRLARQANRPVRALLIRDSEKRVHLDVVKNPKTTDEELVEWSSLSSISPMALKWISTQKRLMQNRTLQLNLVKNPMTPQNIALKLVKLIHISECRKIAKSSMVREAIARVARKRVAEAIERM